MKDLSTIKVSLEVTENLYFHIDVDLKIYTDSDGGPLWEIEEITDVYFESGVTEEYEQLCPADAQKITKHFNAEIELYVDLVLRREITEGDIQKV